MAWDVPVWALPCRKVKIGLNVWTVGRNETEKQAAIKLWPSVEV